MSKIKVSDYIAKRLKECYDVKHFFMVSGGGAMHLNDSLGRCLPYTSNHHEQACAIGAEGYARLNQDLAVVNVTTGPGGLNCLNGVMGQWTDSVPVLYISGQVKYDTCIAKYPELGLRQLGDQEVDIISCVKHLTKYAVMVIEPNEIKYHLDKAIYEATHGRFGPVWLDIPFNVQASIIDEDDLKEFTPPQEAPGDLKMEEVLKSLENAKRPLIIAGHGIKLSRQEANLIKLVENTNIPVVTTFNGYDTIPSANPNYIGRIGTVGQRAGNFVLQNSDCILFLGTRNNIRQVSYNWENFAPKAVKIVIDIDDKELKKPTLKIDLPICADLKDFIPALISDLKYETSQDWLDYCINLKEKYCFDNTLEYKQDGDIIKAYPFVHELTKVATDNIVAANGTACVCLFQTSVIKENQRQFWNSGDASMGYGLPASIGLCLANNKKSTICLEGDGSIMMNIQELETIKHNNLPIKLFIINNGGYSSIRQSQTNFFKGHMTGCGETSGVGMPDFCQLAEGFDLTCVKIEDSKNMSEQIQKVLETEGPVVCEVMVEKDYIFSPKLSAKKLPDGTMVSPSLEDMFPFLDKDELKENMIDD